VSMSKHVLLEIGVEELPARFIDDAEKQLKEKALDWLKENRIQIDTITSYSTPRRLTVIIRDVADKQTTIEEEVRGPQVSIAKDEDGNWTKAATGFAKGQGKSVDDLVEKEVKGKAYVFVTKQILGKETAEILPELKEVITSISFGNTMRWGTGSLRFARPIRWIVALYGQEVIPFEIANIHTGNETRGHRFLGKPFQVQDITAYEKSLEEEYVIVDPEKRKSLILEGIKELEQTHDFRVIVEDDLLREVTNLVEYPTVFMGTFEDHFLQLPSEVLIISMKEHQRYFPVKSHDKLLPYFIGVRNGDNTALDTVIKGNEKVLRARLADAEFFYEEDKNQSIDSYLEKLERVVFQEDLGTIAQKSHRVQQLASQIAERLDFPADVKDDIKRAATISKFDLVTEMVNEFTELQGVIGEIYAKHFGEREAVATAIREQYLPAHATDVLPLTDVGSVLSVAEKLDTIVGIIAVGRIPTGSQDPYGLRRQAVGVLRILEGKNWAFTLEELLELVFEIYDDLEMEPIENYKEKIQEFFTSRALYLLREQGIEQDVFQAVMGEAIGHFAYSIEKAKLLSEKRHDEGFKEKEEALVRVLNLAEDTEASIDPTLFETKSEESLYEQFLESKDKFELATNQKNTEEAFQSLELLAEPIHSFFDNNMVMADENEIRNNRLALVSGIAELILEFADLAKIEWKQNF